MNIHTHTYIINENSILENNFDLTNLYLVLVKKRENECTKFTNGTNSARK